MNNSDCLLYRSASLWQHKLLLKRRCRNVYQTWPLLTVHLISHCSVFIPPAFILFHVPDFLERYFPLFGTVRSSHSPLQQFKKEVIIERQATKNSRKLRYLTKPLTTVYTSQRGKQNLLFPVEDSGISFGFFHIVANFAREKEV